MDTGVEYATGTERRTPPFFSTIFALDSRVGIESLKLKIEFFAADSAKEEINQIAPSLLSSKQTGDCADAVSGTLSEGSAADWREENAGNGEIP